MSDEPMPAFFRAAMIGGASEGLRLSAAAAVGPFVVTPKSNDARSGVASTVPLPVTVIVEPVEGVAERPRFGCATPAIAAATSSAPASRRIVRSLFMHVIRRRAFERHSAWPWSLGAEVADLGQCSGMTPESTPLRRMLLAR